MSFVRKQLALGDTPRNSHPFRLCFKCEEKKPPEGGMDMGSGRWMCAVCWTLRAVRPKGRR